MLRRYSAFEALKNELWWKRIARDVKPELFPPKNPQPQQDLEKLRARAAALETWASLVLRQPDALRTPAVIALFRRARRAACRAACRAASRAARASQCPLAC